MAINVNKISLNGASFETRPYAYCSTAASTAAKAVTLIGFEYFPGASIIVKFTYANTASSPTLNVNSQGAKSIRYNGAALTSAQYWSAGAVIEFVYDGSYFNVIGSVKDNNTTYTEGAGIAFSGTTINHADTNTNISSDTSYGPTANVSGTDGTTVKIPQITLDQFGHVKSVTERTYTSKDTVDKELITFTSSSQSLQPNKYYRLGTTLRSVTITLASPSNVNVLNHYFVEIPCNNTSVTFPSSVVWGNDDPPTWENGYIYQISIINNLGTWQKFSS